MSPGNLCSVNGGVEMELPETEAESNNQREMVNVADTATPTHFTARAKN